jgi:hypothetical protein
MHLINKTNTLVRYNNKNYENVLNPVIPIQLVNIYGTLMKILRLYKKTIQKIKTWFTY